MCRQARGVGLGSLEATNLWADEGLLSKEVIHLMGLSIGSHMRLQIPNRIARSLLLALALIGLPSWSSSPSPPVILAAEAGAAVVHEFTGLPMTSDGWTDLDTMILSAGYSDARIVYVSSSEGSDATGRVYSQTEVQTLGGMPTNPTSAVNAYATISAARNQLRHGYPDVLLLKRGDVWVESLVPSLAHMSGRSQTERKIFAAYGSSGPLPNVRGQITAGTGGGGAPDTADHIIVAHVSNYHPQNDPANPAFNGRKVDTIAMNLRPGANILLEGLRMHFSGIDYSVSVSGEVRTGTAFRRNIISEAYPGGGGHKQGIYADRNDGLLVEENILFHNGWIDRDGFSTAPTQFNHNIYMSWRNKDVIARRNILAESSSHSMQTRGGAVVFNNLSIREPMAPYLGGTRNADGTGGYHGYNVALYSVNRSLGGSGRGYMDASSGESLFERNIAAFKGSGINSDFAMQIRLFNLSDGNQGGASNYAGDKRSLYRENVIYHWFGDGFSLFTGHSGTAGGLESIAFEDNKVVAHPSDTSSYVMRFISDVFSGKVSLSGNQYDSASAQPFQHFGTAMNFSTWVAETGETDATFGDVSFTEPRGIVEYMDHIGEGGGVEGFFEAMLQMDRWNWDSRFTAEVVNSWIRAGFDVPDPSE